jgi:Flp pilus assembly protein TadD
VFKKGVDVLPDNVILLYDLGGVYYALGQENKARVLWTKCLELEPNNESVLRAMKLLKK